MRLTARPGLSCTMRLSMHLVLRVLPKQSASAVTACGRQHRPYCCPDMCLKVFAACRYGRLEKIPISFNKALVSLMSTLHICPKGVYEVHEMLVS